MAACALMAGGMTASAEIVSETTYYLQNKASGRFISSGHAWFTRSTLSPVLDYPIQLNSSGNGYILKVVGSNQLGHNLFVDNGNNNVWTVTAVAGEENVYTIANGTNYLGSDGSFVLSGSLTDATSDAAKWYIRTKDDYLTLFSSASAEKPVDASFYITGPSYDYTDPNRDNKWTMDGFGAGTELTRGSGTTAINPYVVERYNGTGYIKQTLTGLKKGMYGVSVYGFYRAGNNDAATASRTAGNEAQNAIMYAGTAEKPLKSIYDEAKASSVSGSFDTNTSLGYVPNARSTAGECFANGYYKNTIYVYIENDNTELEIGVKKDATIGSDWAIIDNWSMTYYGSEELTETEIVLAASVKTYNEALAAAQAYQSVDMFEEDKTALNTAISSNTIDLSGDVTEEQLTTATNNLTAATAEAANNVARYNTYTTAVLTINNGTNVDLTSLIGNPSFESSSAGVLVAGGWTNEGVGIQGQTNTGFDGYLVGNVFAERWANNVAIGAFKTYQTIEALPAGIYEVSVVATFNGNGASLIVNDAAQAIGDAMTYKLMTQITDKGSITLGVQGVNPTGSWFKCDNFKLTYIGEDFPAYTLATGKMATAEATAQSDAETTFNANKTVDNYNALLAAITNAQTSVNAYASAAAALEEANTVLASTNVYNAADYTAYSDAINAAQTKYNENTFTTAEAAAVEGSLNGGDNYKPNTPQRTFLSGKWSATNSVDIYTNSWSTEGDTDGSGFTAPFIEDWVADGSKLANTEISATMTGLENGLYSVSAQIRLVNTKSGDDAGYDGLTLQVNDGSAVAFADATSYYEGKRFVKTIEAEGLVKDGNLIIKAIINNTNASWFAMKNVKYTKERDLTPQEMAVTPDDLALDAEKTVYKGKTITLTPTSTTENASINGFVTWSSDNEGVATVDANGVVTGVAYGTAYISATSTLNSGATATCAVTVDAPTYDLLENLDFAEGPVIDNIITTYDYDMDKNNTTYSQMQTVSGWIFGVTNGNARAAGIMEYGSSYGMGAANFNAPTTNPYNETTGNALGMVGVWEGTVQYIQNVKFNKGVYTVTIPVYRNGGATALKKNLIGVILDNGTEHLATTTDYGNSWTTETIKFSVTEDNTYGKLSLGLNAPNAGSANCQRLWIDGVTITFEPFATSEEIAALNEAIQTAEDYTLGFDEGEYAPYNNVEALKALAAAKELNTENPIAQSAVTASTAALNGAVWNANTEEVNAFFDGAFAEEYSHEGNVMPIGWHGVDNLDNATNVRLMWNYTANQGLNVTSSNQAAFLKFTGIYGNETGYTLPLKAGLYQLEFIYGGWNEQGTRIIKIYNDDNEATVTPSDVTAPDNKAHTTVDSWRTYKGYVEIPADGDYIFSFYRQNTTQQNQFVFSDIVLKKAVAEDVEMDEAIAYSPEEKYANVTLKRKFSADVWNTFCVPFDIDNATLKEQFGDDVEVSEATLDAEAVNFSAMTEPAITANTPVIIKVPNTSSESYTFEGVMIKTGEAKIAGSGDIDFVGNYAGKLILNEGDYYIASNKLKIATGTQSVKGFRAYFKANKQGARLSMFINGNDATGIESIENTTIADGQTYNLQGQRVTKAQKGLYIVNGKKVVKK